jgi:carboxylesterase type B
MTGSNGQEGRVLVVGQSNLTAAINASFPESALLQQLIAEAYAIGTPGINSGYDAISQIYTDYVFQCPAALVSNESALAGFPTWRYYFNASIPNLNPSAALAALGAPTLNLEAYHNSEIPMVFGTYPSAGATPQEVALSKYMQTAWANFAKDPAGKGPGWPSHGSSNRVNAVGLADLGADGSVGAVMIPEYDVDFRCPLYTAIYAAISVPAF